MFLVIVDYYWLFYYSHFKLALSEGNRVTPVIPAGAEELANIFDVVSLVSISYTSGDGSSSVDSAVFTGEQSS